MSATTLLAQLALALPHGGAPEAQLRGSRVQASPALIETQARAGSRILYLNRCVGGCVIEPGFEDSRTNHSSILERTANMSEWEHGDEGWLEMLSCVRGLYAPFDVLVTDVDPGMEPHFEAIVAGSPPEAGFFGAGGVSPFTCGVIENAITFTLPAIYTSMTQICNVVGQESAHAFGLDHEMECADPLTYLGGCPIKAFQNVDAPCGEFAERECSCGGSTQNSFVTIESIFGPGIVPTVEILEPSPEAEVGLAFAIRAQATDDLQTTRSELWIDGVLRDQLDAEPFAYRAPRTLSPGIHDVEVRVFDDRDQYGSQHVQVVQEPCARTLDCDFAFVCVGGQCVLGPGNQGGLGASCEGSEECDSTQCATDHRGGFCSTSCQLDQNSCPSGFACTNTVDEELVCIPDPGPPSGGFCSGSGGSSSAGWALLLLLWALCGTRSQHVKRRNRGSQS